MYERVGLSLLLLALVGLSSCGNAEYTSPPEGEPDASGMGMPDRMGAAGSVMFGRADGDTAGSGGSSPCGNDVCPPEPEAGPVCGDGLKDETEGCDDGNVKPGDGCSYRCTLESNYTCPEPGKPCISTVVCGDGVVSDAEACDDHNADSGDGCSSLCVVEKGYVCKKPGELCVVDTSGGICGDGEINFGESCDDKNKVDGDGCSSDCKVIEDNWHCPKPGDKCVKDEYCGDGVLNGTEQCDDGNTDAGDGCSGACTTEKYFECKVAGKPCTTTIVCGDKKIVADEACDDGNTVSGDGCSSDCKTSEKGYTCPTASGVGGACTPAPEAKCGNGDITYGEFCDDGNATPGDGCSDLCKSEPGYDCPEAGKACHKIGQCGDGLISTGEGCDDHNVAGGDGCSPTCQIEPNFVCPAEGMACVSTVKCGDGFIAGSETCDDQNTVDGDGCSKTCQVEPGWTCLSGICRAIACGDGLRAGAEECDDHNTSDGNPPAGDGCSATCTLESAPNGDKDGWQCLTPGQACTRTNCGNGQVEGSEQCDDGNNRPLDGCSWNCTKEPSCGYTSPGVYGCTAVCGDGMLFPGEECDDGDTRDGDGCSHLCKIETGYSCTASRPAQASPLHMPIVYRDFPATHPQFEINPRVDQRLPNMVLAALDAQGKPAYNSAFQSPLNSTAAYSNKAGWTLNGAQPNADNAATLLTAAAIQSRFSEWYRDVAGTNLRFDAFLDLNYNAATGAFEYYNASFFPIDGKGWVASGQETATNGHNYHFTSELRYWFQYVGNEVLEFRGDDDVWVFVNGALAVDIGGIHNEITGTVTLNGATTQVCYVPGPACATVPLALEKDTIYEIVVFQAERHVVGSNYKLSLKGFNVPKSTCAPICGDGKVVGNESCDKGVNGTGGTGDYGTCNANCTFPARCGDATVNGPEQCDNGLNLATYSPTRQCGPGCKWAAYCGDGVTSNGEQCDEGSLNGSGYGHCAANCTLGPRCGDGTPSNGEDCDDGIRNGTSSSACRADCRSKCGDATLDPGEQCDDGTASNTGAYGKCKGNCTYGPRCGDGIKQVSEACDDGKNDGSYGTCSPGCVAAPRCGDGTVQSTAGEICDRGAANETSAYGKDHCVRCKPAPFCGDKAVDTKFGEACDDGVNSGEAGSCKVDCSGWVPLPSCGDGTRQTGEQCDDGSLNGTAGSACDTHCKTKCGNGYKDAGEECDDGKNDGSYGTCTPQCKLAAYCGDSVVNGAEVCDPGPNPEASAYGAGKCTSTCTWAPYCGDGRIQNPPEECDGTAGCDNVCKIDIAR